MSEGLLISSLHSHIAPLRLRAYKNRVGNSEPQRFRYVHDQCTYRTSKTSDQTCFCFPSQLFVSISHYFLTTADCGRSSFTMFYFTIFVIMMLISLIFADYAFCLLVFVTAAMQRAGVLWQNEDHLSDAYTRPSSFEEMTTLKQKVSPRRRKRTLNNDKIKLSTTPRLSLPSRMSPIIPQHQSARTVLR